MEVSENESGRDDANADSSVYLTPQSLRSRETFNV